MKPLSEPKRLKAEGSLLGEITAFAKVTGNSRPEESVLKLSHLKSFFRRSSAGVLNGVFAPCGRSTRTPTGPEKKRTVDAAERQLRNKAAGRWSSFFSFRTTKESLKLREAAGKKKSERAKFYPGGRATDECSAGKSNQPKKRQGNGGLKKSSTERLLGTKGRKKIAGGTQKRSRLVSDQEEGS